MLNPLDNVVRHQKGGEAFGVTSICSAHPLVLEAAMLQASDDGSHVLVEATSNQVDQTGGYTGMRPKDFRDLVFETAARSGLPSARVLLGGDHLGPNRWRHLPTPRRSHAARRGPRGCLRRGWLHQNPSRLQLSLCRRPDAFDRRLGSRGVPPG